MAAKKSSTIPQTPARVRVGITDKDMGWKAFRDTVNAFIKTRPDVVTGIFGPEATTARSHFTAVKKHEARERRRSKKGQYLPTAQAPSLASAKGLSNAQLAAIHEFGLAKHIPMRSFLRSTFDLNKFAYRHYLVVGMRRELFDVAKKRVPMVATESQTMKRLALKMEGDIKKRIGNRQITPPNAPSTVRRKKSSTPLVDTGQLRRSVTSAIRTGGSR